MLFLENRKIPFWRFIIIKKSLAKNRTQMQLENRSLLLNFIKNNENICRKDLAEMTGLTGAAVTNLVRDLIEVGIVTEYRGYEGPRSRNALSLKINYEKYFIIGISFRRGSITYGVSDLAGKIFKKNKLLLELSEPVDKVFKALNSVIESCITEFSIKGKIVGLGLSFPGPINLSKREISYLTNLPGWKDIEIKKYLEDKFDFPVIIGEAANATAVAEKWFGCAKEYKNFISILISQGVGAGIVINGKIYWGESGFAGEIGHVSIDYNGPQCSCGNKGCLELYCSTLSLLKKAQSIYSSEKIKNFDDILKKFNNDKKILDLVTENGKYLGFAIVNLINSFNPELIVIHSEMNKFGDIWIENISSSAIRRLLPEISSNVKIKYSTLKDDPVFLGAIAMVCAYIFEKPHLKYFLSKSKK